VTAMVLDLVMIDYGKKRVAHL